MWPRAPSQGGLVVTNYSLTPALLSGAATLIRGSATRRAGFLRLIIAKMDEETLFVVSARGPTGIFWLSEPSPYGLRTLVTRDEAAIFATIEGAQSAIDKMSKGYQLARVSFAIELSDARRLRQLPQRGPIARNPEVPEWIDPIPSK